jgi:hypothetical protein
LVPITELTKKKTVIAECLREVERRKGQH